MDLNEMHVWFRQYAQQMGMQNVRAILPEQIDVLINTSISDTVDEIIRVNIGLTNDRVITDNSKLGQINALRTLYCTADLAIGKSTDSDVQVIYEEGTPDGLFTCENFFGDSENTKIKGLFIVDFSINYRKTSSNGNSKTSKYPVRIIDNMYLADTLQDFVLKPRVRTPIAVVYNTVDDVDGNATNKLDLYLGSDYDKGNGLLRKNTLTPQFLTVGYIKHPNKVVYRRDIGEDNIDCDLPAHMHVPILKHAVDLYRVSIQGSLYANQQQQQAQQREVGRNNVRPDNEGYQQ